MIDGISIANYRSFGPQIQELKNTSRMNVIIGKNNVGKSNLLNVFTFILPFVSKIRPGDGLNWDGALDASKFASDADFLKVGLFLRAENFCRHFASNLSGPIIEELRDKIVNAATKTGLDGIWYYRQNSNNEWTTIVDERVKILLSTAFPRTSLHDISLNFTGTGFHRDSDNVRSIMDQFNPFATRCEVAFIPAIRSTKFQIQSGQSIKDDVVHVAGIADYSGSGLIERLFKLQIPDFRESKSEQRFLDLTKFVRTVTGEPTLELKIPHTKSAIHLSIEDRYLPLSSFGSGIEQLVIIAATATVHENSIVCLEEPETNLHPEFQVRLLEYLASHTSNQYFITTHSHSIIDFGGASVYSVQWTAKGSQLAELFDQNTKHEIVFDLGYRPSDMAQSNCVIWVEGPSDRIYLKHEILKALPELSEGVDYSIMFYGGKLLSHVSAESDPHEEFAVLTQINRRSAIVIDSDFADGTETLGSQKQRVVSQFKNAGLIAWVTEGREIENYLDESTLMSARSHLWPNWKFNDDNGKYAQVCDGFNSKGRSAVLDKIRLAHYVTSEGATFRFDWNEKIAAIVDFVANSQ